LNDDIHFPTFFCRQQLSSSSFNTSAQSSEKVSDFTTEDAALYTEFRELLASSRLDQQAQFTIAVNATAACNYVAPSATKSWFFTPLNRYNIGFQSGDIVEAQAITTGYYLVLESDDLTSSIILLSEQQTVDTNRVFKQGHVIKVHNDRLEKKPSINSVLV
jgi:hypothetical protein